MKGRIKPIIFLAIAAFFIGDAIYAGGTIRSFFGVIIALVFGLFGGLHLKSYYEEHPRKTRKH